MDHTDSFAHTFLGCQARDNAQQLWTTFKNYHYVLFVINRQLLVTHQVFFRVRGGGKECGASAPRTAQCADQAQNGLWWVRSATCWGDWMVLRCDKCILQRDLRAQSKSHCVFTKWINNRTHLLTDKRAIFNMKVARWHVTCKSFNINLNTDTNQSTL